MLMKYRDFKIMSNDEMKNVKGGSATLIACYNGPCSVYVDGQTYKGTCGYYDGNGSGTGGVPPTWSICECKTDYGMYLPNGGTSHCEVA